MGFETPKILVKYLTDSRWFGGKGRKIRSLFEPWAEIWYNYISDIFINSYLKTVRNILE